MGCFAGLLFRSYATPLPGIVCSRVLTVTKGLWSGLYRLRVAVVGRCSRASCVLPFEILFGVDRGPGDGSGYRGPRAGIGETSLLSNPEAVFTVTSPVRFMCARPVVPIASADDYSMIWSIVVGPRNLASALISFMLRSGCAVFTHLYTWFLRLTRGASCVFGKSSNYCPAPSGPPLKMSVGNASLALPTLPAESSDGGGKRSSIHFLKSALDPLGPRFCLLDYKWPAAWLYDPMLLLRLSLIGCINYFSVNCFAMAF